MTKSMIFRKSHPKGLQGVHVDKLRARAANYRVEKQAPLPDVETQIINGDCDFFVNGPTFYYRTYDDHFRSWLEHHYYWGYPHHYFAAMIRQ